MNKTKFDFVDEDAVAAGETLRKGFQFLDKENKGVDITGWTARMHVRVNFDSAAPITGGTFTTENGGLIIEEGTEGVLWLYASAATTSAYLTSSDTAAVTYKYDLELITPSGEVGKPLYGKFKVLPEITK